MNRIQSTIIPRFAAVALAAVACTTAMAQADDAELDEIRGKVGEMFEFIDPEDVSHAPIDGWYQIHKGSIVAYISADGRFLLQGDLIDLDQQVNLSESTRNDARRELLASLPDDRTIVFAPDEVKYSVSIFTDVECTYCRRLHNQIEEYLAHGIEVRYLMYPRNGPASRAWNTAENVWCAADRQNALTMAKQDREFPTGSCDASIVQDHYVLGRDVGLSGTPAIVLEDGSLIAGYLSPDQLAAALQEKFQ